MTDSPSMKTSRAFWGGVIGAGVMSALTTVARLAGVPLNVEAMVGSLLVGTTTGASLSIGLVVHLIAGGLFGLLYGALFERIHRADWNVGMLFGAVHALIAGMVLGAMPMMHPLVPTEIPPPGPFMSGAGVASGLIFIALHLVYGAIVGAAYAPVARTPRDEEAHAPA